MEQRVKDAIRAAAGENRDFDSLDIWAAVDPLGPNAEEWVLDDWDGFVEWVCDYCSWRVD